MKKFLLAVAVLLVLIAGGVWYFVSFRLDDMIRQQIELSGTDVLGTRVAVGAVTTDLKAGSLTIESITVANPPGYANPSAFSLNGIEAAVDYQTGEVRRIIIDRPEIVVEEIDGRTNFTDLLARIEQPGTQEPADPGQPQPVITIRHFRMSEARAAFESKSTDRYTDLKIRSVELENISGTPEEVGAEVLTAIVEKVVAAAAVELVRAKATEKLEGLLNRD
jgi:hypothetical protein